MLKPRRYGPATVRPRSWGKVPWLVCLLAFCATALLVYRWGRENWRSLRSDRMYTAAAYVVECSRPHAAETRFPVIGVAQSPRRAAEKANTAADRYADQRRAQWQAARDRLRLTAQQTAQRARLDFAQSETRARHSTRQMRQAAAAVAPAPPTAEPPTAEPPTDNPQWLELRQQLEELKRRRGQLLVDRTPLHPAVQAVEVRIAATEARWRPSPGKYSLNQHPLRAPKTWLPSGSPSKSGRNSRPYRSGRAGALCA